MKEINISGAIVTLDNDVVLTVAVDGVTREVNTDKRINIVHTDGVLYVTSSLNNIAVPFEANKCHAMLDALVNDHDIRELGRMYHNMVNHTVATNARKLFATLIGNHDLSDASKLMVRVAALTYTDMSKVNAVVLNYRDTARLELVIRDFCTYYYNKRKFITLDNLEAFPVTTATVWDDAKVVEWINSNMV